MSKNLPKQHIEQVLKRLGLSENEAGLYFLMLQNPASTVQELQKKTPFPRTLLYHLLGKLSQENLVTPHKKRARTTFIAEDPERLYDLLEKKEREFNQIKSDVKEVIPQLRQTFRLSSSRPGMRFLEGLNNYRTALEDVCNIKADLLFLYAPDETAKKLPGVEIRKTLFLEYRQKGISLKILTKNREAARTWTQLYGSNKLFEIKMLSGTQSFEMVDMRLYSGKILYTKYDKREPLAVLLEDQALYEMQRGLFKELWKQATHYSN